MRALSTLKRLTAPLLLALALAPLLASAPAQARSAWRMSQAHDITNARTGIRLVREI